MRVKIYAQLNFLQVATLEISHKKQITNIIMYYFSILLLLSALHPKSFLAHAL
jgi:hypothetical protein